MGGVAVLRDLAEAGTPYFRSMESVLEKSQVGKTLTEFLRNEVEPAIGKEANALRQSRNINAMDAWKTAKESVLNMSFGSRKQGLIPLLKAAQSQGGPTHAAEMADAMQVYLHDSNPYWRIAARKAGVDINAFKSSYENQSSVERGFRRLAAPMFLPRISIPHAPQAILNSLIVDGWQATAKAFKDFATSPKASYDLSLQAGAQSQELMHEFINQVQGRSMFTRLLDPLRKVFNFERKWGIAFSAVSGKWSAIDAATELAANPNSKRAALQLKVLGLDPNDVLAKGGMLSPDDIEQVAYRAASEIMGLRSPLETPYGWEKNWAMRVATLYKHYGFRQARLIKDAALRAKAAEGWTGVAKVASTVGSAFFIAGEGIKAVEDVISGRQPWNDQEEKDNFMGSEFIDGIAHAGGFGIIYSTLRGAKHNHLLGYVAGPVISSTTDLVQDIVTGNTRQLTKDIGRKFGLPGTAITNILLPPKKKKDTTYY